MFEYPIDHEITLKLLDLNDAPTLFQLTERDREYLREWLPWVDGTTKQEDSEAFIHSCLKAFKEKEEIHLGIFWKDELAGVFGLHGIDWSNRSTQFGYWLGAAFQGNGIMTRVVKAMIQYAFDELQLNRVEIRAAVGNKKSRAIPERLGFSKEGCLRQAAWLNDRYIDLMVYGMVKEEWSKESDSLQVK
jgi:ribosomal-protein-serine acetyltransferase